VTRCYSPDLIMNTKLVPLPSAFTDERGYIQTLLNDHKGSVVIISSVPHVERANHYHKEDYHYCYILTGSIHYYERVVSSDDIPSFNTFYPGTMIYTPPMVEHTMYFDEPTTFITLGGGTRHQEDYESDLVRVDSLRTIYNLSIKKEQ